jgi:hypothetical protein
MNCVTASQKLKAAISDLGLKQVGRNMGSVAPSVDQSAISLYQVPLDPAFAANGMTAVYYPNGVTASDLLPKLVKNNIVIAAGLHRDIKGMYFLSSFNLLLILVPLDQYFRIGFVT